MKKRSAKLVKESLSEFLNENMGIKNNDLVQAYVDEVKDQSNLESGQDYAGWQGITNPQKYLNVGKEYYDLLRIGQEALNDAGMTIEDFDPHNAMWDTLSEMEPENFIITQVYSIIGILESDLGPDFDSSKYINQSPLLNMRDYARIADLY